MPLGVLNVGDKKTIVRIIGKGETKKFLKSLGFVCGEQISIVSKMGENLIVMIKGSRVAISAEMARKIIV